jgi:hypothetical protein
MNILEDMRLRTMVLKSSNSLALWTYSHSIVRWKKLLLYLTPELCEVVGIFEKAEKALLSRVFECFEDVQSSDKRILIGLLVLMSDEVQRLRTTQRLDASLADHLQLAIKNRLQVFCTGVLDLHPPKKPRKKLRNLWLAQMIDYNRETSSCLPPHYRGYSDAIWLTVHEEARRHLDPNSLNFTSCLVSRSNSAKGHHDSAQIDRCCCGWISDSIPAGVLNLFGFSAKTFLRYFHSESAIGLGIPRLTSEDHKVTNTMLRSWYLENVSLLYKMTIFHEAFRVSLEVAIERTLYFNDNEAITLSQDQLLAHAGSHREMLFIYVLETASEIMQAFLTFRREGCTDLKDFRKPFWSFIIGERMFHMGSLRLWINKLCIC